jgi:hypothetical protein
MQGHKSLILHDRHTPPTPSFPLNWPRNWPRGIFVSDRSWICSARMSDKAKCHRDRHLNMQSDAGRASDLEECPFFMRVRFGCAFAADWSAEAPRLTCHPVSRGFTVGGISELLRRIYRRRVRLVHRLPLGHHDAPNRAKPEHSITSPDYPILSDFGTAAGSSRQVRRPIAPNVVAIGRRLKPIVPKTARTRPTARCRARRLREGRPYSARALRQHRRAGCRPR